MKKVMFAAAAMAAGLAMADVQSANVVGYNNISLVQGSQYKGPQFVAIGATGKMLDVKVSGYTGDIDAEYVTVSKINTYGIGYKDLIWQDIPSDEIYGWYWYDEVEDEMVDCNDDPLLIGEGLKIQTQMQAVDWDFVSSGEVDLDGVSVTLAQGAQYLANAVPRDTTFGEVIVDGYVGDIDAEYVTISRLNEYGVGYKDLIWQDIPGDEIYGWYWYDEVEDEMVDCNDEELPAGEALKVQAQLKAVGWTIIFPPAIPETK